MTRKEPIKILGAGPSGMAAAIVLGQAGYRVEIHDLRSDVGGRFNNDYQGIENWSIRLDAWDEFERMGIKIDDCAQPFYGGVMYNPQFKPINVQTERPLFYLVKRGNGSGTLDWTLKKQALRADVEFHFNDRVKPEEMHIVSSGPRYSQAIAAGVTFETSMPNGAYVILNDDLAPKGYVYLLIASGKATLATVLFEEFSEARKCLDLSIERFTKLLKIDGMRNLKQWGGFGSFGLPRTAVRDGKYYIGEAAGFQDLLFMFGIRYSIVSGFLAAKSIIDGIDYDRAWKRRLRPLMKASIVNRFLFSVFSRPAYHLLWRSVDGGDPTRVMRWLYSWTLPHQIIYPVARIYFGSMQR